MLVVAVVLELDPEDPETLKRTLRAHAHTRHSQNGRFGGFGVERRRCETLTLCVDPDILTLTLALGLVCGWGRGGGVA